MTTTRTVRITQVRGLTRFWGYRPIPHFPNHMRGLCYQSPPCPLWLGCDCPTHFSR